MGPGSKAPRSDGEVWLRFPTGEAKRVNDPSAAELIGQAVGEPVTVVKESGVSHFDEAALHLLTLSAPSHG
jgi:hypothetical protein